MRTYLVVAHRTLVGQHLLDHVRSLCDDADNGQCRFYLVVPVRHPSDHAWTEGEVDGVAQRRLEEGLQAFRDLGVEADGEVGDANPVYAVGVALRGRPYDDDRWDGIVVSTLPSGVSRWLGLDVVSRIKYEYEGIPVTHLVAPRVEADA